MTLKATYASDFVPHDNPCAQCGKLIAKPIWSEPGEFCQTYVWRCLACDYEFTCTAVYPQSEARERELAA